MISENILSALFTTTQQRVLGVLYGQPERSFHLQEIVREAGIGRGTVQRLLKRLDDAGIIRRQESGRQVYYQADDGCIIFAELRDIIRKTYGMVDIIRDGLAPVRAQIQIAFIFGSMARGDDRPDSDIDLMVIGDIRLRQLASYLREMQTLLRRDINTATYSVAEYQDKLRQGHHFLTSLQKEPKLFVFGTNHELNKLGK